MANCHDSGYDEEASPSNGGVHDEFGRPTDDVTPRYRQLTIVPPSERLAYDDDDDDVVAVADRRSLSSSTSSSASCECRRDDGFHRLRTSGQPRLREAKLLWHNTEHRHIWDLEFMADGKLVIISGEEATLEGRVVTVNKKRLHCLHVRGDALDVPFPGQYREPSGISLCKKTGALAITETSPGASAGTITILRYVNNNNNNNNKWIFKTHDTEQPAYRVALTRSDTAVCAIRWEKLVKYNRQTPVWSQSISASNELIPYISVGPNGRIVVSTPSTNRVSVFSDEGRLLVVFPTWFIRKPAGVCTDSGARVLVADKGNQKILHFTDQGSFIQTLVRTENPPACIDLYDDRYLVVGTHLDGLYLYELLWE